MCKVLTGKLPITTRLGAAIVVSNCINTDLATLYKIEYAGQVNIVCLGGV